MKIAIGSDKSGFVLKEAIKKYLEENNFNFEDLGTIDPDNAKGFFIVAPEVAKRVQSKEFNLAILVCGTGAGMNIVANKYEGVHAVACESIYSATMARAINNAQIICMGGWIVAPELGVKMAEAFLNTDWLQDLEPWRKEWLDKASKEVKAIEDSIY